MTTPNLLAPAAPPLESSAQPSAAQAGTSMLPVLFVAFVWAAMYAGDIAFIGAFGRDVPHADDWEFVPAATHPGVRLRWAFAQHMEHRTPVPRLLVLGLLKISGLDFRSGMYFNATAFALLALAMVLTARAVRGRTLYADAVFPLLLLNLGHWDGFLFTCLVDFVSTAVLAGIVLLGIVNRGNRLRIGSAVLLGVAVVLVTMTGGHGLLFAPLPALWLACAGAAAVKDRTGRERVAGLVALTLAAVALASFTFSCLSFHSVQQPRRLGLGPWLSTAIAFVGLGFGKAGWFGTVALEAILPLAMLGACRIGFRRRLTWSEIVALIGCAVLVRVLIDQCERAHLPLPLPSQRVAWGWIGGGAAALAAAVLFRALRVLPAERWRALGLLACLGGMLCLAAGLGYARAGSLSATIYTPRYFLLAIDLPCVVVFALELYGGERLLRFSRPTLLVLAAALALFSAVDVRPWRPGDAILYGRARRDALDALLRDVRTGVPAGTVVTRYGGVMGIGYLPVGPEDLIQDMRDLRDAGHPGFQALNDAEAGTGKSR
jgi:hypothetical protein